MNPGFVQSVMSLFRLRVLPFVQASVVQWIKERDT